MVTPNTQKRYRQSLSALGLNEGVTFDEVKTAYRNLAKKWHPDRYARKPRELAKAEARMRRINAAYEWLEENKWVFDVDWNKSVREVGWYSQPMTIRDYGEVLKWGVGGAAIIKLCVLITEHKEYNPIFLSVLAVGVVVFLFYHFKPKT